MQVTLADGTPPFIDLPGGAIDPGETGAQAVVREFAEETGLAVVADVLVARAAQYFLTAKGEPVNNRCTFHVVYATKEAAEKIEDDHELVWLEPLEALTLLRHPAHAWGLAAYLRSKPSQA